MKHLLIMLFIFCSIFSKGQNPLVKMWDRRYGTHSADDLRYFQQTIDGGYMLAGNTSSGIDGDKTQANWGGGDYWIVKLDSLGNKIWDKDFGGTSGEFLNSAWQTKDGGYILGGWSASGIGGDKTQDTIGTCDYWIIKIDSLGNKQWDKDFGGSAVDILISLQQTTDGGYLLGGYSYSQISGDKTEDVRGTTGDIDYWIVKTDSLGNKQWDKDFGGTNYDVLYSLRQTSDKGYILGGYSASGIGWDKTQGCWGINDYWIIKIDSSGNKEWDKDYGGTGGDYPYSVEQTADDGYIICGHSDSNISGNKSQSTWAFSLDYWIVKTDSIANIQWDKDFGGTGAEPFPVTGYQTNDRGYLIIGNSESPVSGDKTEANLGVSQAWMLKTDSIGNMEWDKTIFTLPDSKTYPFVVEVNNGCFVVAKSTFGGVAGYKSQENRDTTYFSTDYWIVKFCDSSFLRPTATAFSDSLLCPGTCTNFTNLSFNATNYQWNFFGASPDTSTAVNPQGICYASPGTYDVQLIASNANGSDTLLLTNYITVYPSPPPQAISQSVDTLFAIAGSASYQWYFNGNIINGATDYFYIAIASGDYNVVATDVNGCEVEAAIFNVLANAWSLVIGQWSLYPNPVSDKLTIHKAQVTRGTAVEISIYNMLGEMELAVDLPTAYCLLPTCSIDVSNLPPGLYYIEITADEKLFRNKFVKQ